MLAELIILGLRYNTKKKEIHPNSPEAKFLKAYSVALKYVLPRYGFKAPKKEIRENFIGRPLGKPFTKDELGYMVYDVEPLLKLQRYQEAILTRDGLMEVALLENLVSERYHDMFVKGIGFDKDIWKKIADANTKEFNRRSSKLPKEVENWNSPAQVKKYFFNKGIMLPSYKELDEVYLQTKNKILGDFIFARELHKAVTSYGYSWFEDGYISEIDGRIHCGINQIINTARNSMYDPNLQQLPGEGNDDYLHLLVMEILYGGDEKKTFQHRRAFVPKPGHCFVICDFGGQEIGIMAANSGEQLWIKAMLRGEDVHSLTASLIKPTEWAAATEKGCTFPKKCKCKGHKEQRRPAKVNNFMLAYGGGATKFAKKTGSDERSARMYVAAHKRVIPRLTQWLEKNGREAVATGKAYSADPYKRRRVLNGVEEWHVRNQGKNTPVQMSGANLLKLALASLPWDIPVVLVVHDEIVAEVPFKQAIKAARTMKSIMEESADFITGIKGLIKVDPKIQCNLMKEMEPAKEFNKIKTGKYCYEV